MMYKLSKRHEVYAKLFYIFTALGLLGYIILAYHSLYSSILRISQLENYQESALYNLSKQSMFDIKYILFWTLDDDNNYIEEGQHPFFENNCSFTNCFISTNKKLLGDYKNFDALIFNLSVIRKWKSKKLPKNRSTRQKYIFYGMESSIDNVICDIHADDFFNWTWSYKLYSDIFTPFIEVVDKNGIVVAPDPDVVWKHDEDASISEESDSVVKSKSIAWIVNKCEGLKSRMMFVQQLENALVAQFRNLDIYGCGYLVCPNYTLNSCIQMIKSQYYCYLACEDNMSNDYVSTEVLLAYNNDAIPIVMGGSDYSKFLPENSYIYARHMELDKLAATVDYVIQNSNIYKSYFNWKKQYIIKEKKHSEGFCQLCELLNSASFVAFSTYQHFRTWWYQGILKERCYPKSAENYKELLSYMQYNTTNSTYNTESKELFHRSIKV